VVPGAAGKVVAAVQGLSDFEIRELREAHGRPRHREAGVRYHSPPHPARSRSSSTLPAFGRADKAFQYQRHLPDRYLTGSRYGGIITDVAPNLPPCGYDRMNAGGIRPQTLYNQKLNGNGRLWCSSMPTVRHDFGGRRRLLADSMGCRAVSDNIEIYYPTGPTNCGGNMWLMWKQPRRGVVAHGSSGSFHRPWF